MGTYEIWTSENGTDYTKLMEGEFTKEDYNLHKVGDLYNVGDMVYVNFENKVKTQYVRVVQIRSSFWHRCGIFKRGSGFLCRSGRKKHR